MSVFNSLNLSLSYTICLILRNFGVVGRSVCDVTEFHLVHIIYLWTFLLFEVKDESSSYYECNCSSEWISCPSSHCDRYCTSTFMLSLYFKFGLLIHLK